MIDEKMVYERFRIFTQLPLRLRAAAGMYVRAYLEAYDLTVSMHV